MNRGSISVTAAACMALVLNSCGASDSASQGSIASSGQRQLASGVTTVAAEAAVSEQDALPTATPIKHVVIVFGENQSFDHYFGTYPKANNPPGEPIFTAASGTPQPNGYLRNPSLLTDNPNTHNASNLATGISPALMNPFRIDRAQFDTASQNHAYTPEQRATDNFKMDAFVANTGNASAGGAGAFGTKAQVMGYFDGNTVTAMWNLAQRFAMNDNAFTDSFGPSTPGAMNVIAGTTNGASNASGSGTVADGQGGFTVIGDPDPKGDICTTGSNPVIMSGKNIGDLLNAAGITWGGFMGGFDTAAVNPNGTTACRRSTVSPNTGRTVTDYSPHHAFFQYWASTQNKNHVRPSSVAMIGHSEATDAPGGATAVNHQYDYNDFVAAVKAGNFPSVSYIKAQAYQDGHPSNSNPLDEQAFVANLLNFLQQQPDWANTAVIIVYDDSDGWYDHLEPTLLTASHDASADQVTGPGNCDSSTAHPALGVNGGVVNGRCGPGTRIPFLLVSPYARVNYLDSTPLSQASVVRFIEDNWLNGQRLGGGSNDADVGSIMSMFDFASPPNLTPLYLNPTTGRKLSAAPAV